MKTVVERVVWSIQVPKATVVKVVPSVLTHQGLAGVCGCVRAWGQVPDGDDVLANVTVVATVLAGEIGEAADSGASFHIDGD